MPRKKVKKWKLWQQAKPAEPEHPPVDDVPLAKKRNSKQPEFRSELHKHCWEEFWEEYPRKVGKYAARLAWDRAVTTSGEHKTVMKALRAQRAQLLRRGLEFCPHASTWINGKRWLDEIEDLDAPLVNGRAPMTPLERMIREAQ